MTATYALGRGFTMSRQFDAPVDLVFASWTETDLLGWFYNPGYSTDEPIRLDLRVGGIWRQLMIENADKRYFTGGLYREIVPNRKLAFNWGAEGGWPELDPANPDDSPLVTLMFTPMGEQTEMDLHLQLPDHFTPETTDWWMNCGMQQGWPMTVDRLAAQLAARAA